jgi:hypothetical protein
MKKKTPIIKKYKKREPETEKKNQILKEKKEKKIKAKEIISKYHEYNKKIEQIKKEEINENDKKKKIQEIEKEKEELGGIDKYQKISLIKETNQKKNNLDINQVVKWVQSFLDEEKNYKLLDVGTLNKRFENIKNIKPRSIDLNPVSNSEIEKKDFFDVKEKFDIIVLSLVLNFEGKL